MKINGKSLAVSVGLIAVLLVVLLVESLSVDHPENMKKR